MILLGLVYPGRVHYTRLGLFLLFTVFFVGYPYSKIYSQTSYPEWFVHQGEFENVIIGFGDSETSKIDAAKRYCVYDNCFLEGHLDFYNDFDLKNSDYEYFYDAVCEKQVEDSLYALDAFIIDALNEDIISLFSIGSEKQIESNLIRMEPSAPPGWIKTSFFRTDSFYYGVGIYTAKANQMDAWKTAENKAILGIIQNTDVRVHSVKIKTEHNTDEQDSATMEKIQSIRLNHQLTGIQPMERWLDTTKQQVFVLVRIPTNGIKPLYGKIDYR